MVATSTACDTSVKLFDTYPGQRITAHILNSPLCLPGCPDHFDISTAQQLRHKAYCLCLFGPRPRLVFRAQLRLGLPMPPSTLPPTLPGLPSASHHTWSANIQTAHQVLANIYHHAFTITRQEDAADPLRITFHIDTITFDAILILSAIEEEAEAEDCPDESQLPREWLHAAAELFGKLVLTLKGAEGLTGEQ